jgi:hypothetical protein
MSGLPPVATELRTFRIGSFGPEADIRSCRHVPLDQSAAIV